MTNKNWQTILMYPHHLNEKERERRMGKGRRRIYKLSRNGSQSQSRCRRDAEGIETG